jgi:hypothetical protein
MSKAAIAGGALLLIASAILAPAASADDNVQKLLQECSADNPSYDLFYCLGRVGGIADMMGLNGIIMGKPEERSIDLLQVSTCTGKPPPSYGAKVQVFKNWAQNHPDRWADQDYVGVITALRQQWRCR